jgi:hypothetical protein
MFQFDECIYSKRQQDPSASWKGQRYPSTARRLHDILRGCDSANHDSNKFMSLVILLFSNCKKVHLLKAYSFFPKVDKMSLGRVMQLLAMLPKRWGPQKGGISLILALSILLMTNQAIFLLGTNREVGSSSSDAMHPFCAGQIHTTAPGFLHRQPPCISTQSATLKKILHT